MLKNILISTGKRWCRQKESNFRPHPYQGCALPLSYGGGTSFCFMPQPIGGRKPAFNLPSDEDGYV